MKQISFFLFFFTFKTFTSLSQNTNTFPALADVPKWYLMAEQYGFMGSTFKRSTLQYQGDTMLCGKKYSLGLLENKLFYSRTEGDKTYLRNNAICSQSEELIYDFGMKTGDTLDVKPLIGFSSNKKYKFKVKNVDSLVFEGKKLKRLKMEYAFYNQTFFNFQMDWVEGVGSNEHPFYPIVPLTSHALDGSKFYTLCTYHNNNLVYGDNQYSTCSASLLDTAVFPLYKDAARWNVGKYETTFSTGDVEETDIVYYQKDTTICSKNYSKIELKGQINQATAYIRREGRKVYYRPANITCDDEDNLLYNFDLKKGNSDIFIHPVDGKEYLYELKNIENVTFFGKTRQKYSFEIFDFNTNQKKGKDTWIEGVGSLVHPFHTFIKPANDGYWFTLLCSYRNQNQQYMNSNSKSCYITKVATKDVISSNIEVELWPNPFYNSLTINILKDNNETFNMELFNTIGQKIIQQNIAAQTTLDLAFLPQGTYFIMIQNKDKSSSLIKKIIKI